jgi:hypothetical protein
MGQIWTIIFFAILAIGWWIASWHDREEYRRHRQRNIVSEKRDKSDSLVR